MTAKYCGLGAENNSDGLKNGFLLITSSIS
jgi:hypothetical protein